MISIVDPLLADASLPPSSPAPSTGRIKEELLATISASRLGTWLGCRLKFYFRYVLGIIKPTTPARHVGSVVHAVLRQWNLARWRRAQMEGEMIAEVFNQMGYPFSSTGDRLALRILPKRPAYQGRLPGDFG